MLVQSIFLTLSSQWNNNAKDRSFMRSVVSNVHSFLVIFWYGHSLGAFSRDKILSSKTSGDVNDLYAQKTEDTILRSGW